MSVIRLQDLRGPSKSRNDSHERVTKISGASYVSKSPGRTAAASPSQRGTLQKTRKGIGERVPLKRARRDRRLVREMDHAVGQRKRHQAHAQNRSEERRVGK